MPDLSLIMPTLGRPSIDQAFESVLPYLSKKDEVLIVYDPNRRYPRPFVKINTKAKVRTFFHGTTGGRTDGSQQKNFGMLHASRSHICFLDDDDVYTPDAVEKFREYAANVPVIFKMEFQDRDLTLWKEPKIEYGNVGTPMFLVPNRKDLLGTFTPKTRDANGNLWGDDLNFITETVERMGGVEWVDHVTALINPTGPQ